MQLWNDYEGQTIAEAYPLNKLIRPEGRSAFFLTTNGTGTPAMVRVIEAHFDESEILNRWRAVSEIKQENLVAMRKFGETELDGTPLVYAVMEPTEISLAELLENRTLTVDEAKQLAASLVAALTALHERGLIHEHIDPANILAAGEVVKLRSDCVRQAIADPESGLGTVAEQKARDAHALAVLLLQALTGRRSLQGSATLLPPPFDGIIRNGLSGKWGLAEMATALGPVKPAQVAAAVPNAQAVATQPSASKPADAPSVMPAATPATKPAVAPETRPAAAPEAKTPVSSRAAAAPKSNAEPAAAPVPRPVAAAPTPQPIAPAHAPDVRHRIVRPVEPAPRHTRLFWIAGAVGVVLLLLFWRMMHSESANGAKAAAHPITTLGPAKTGEGPTTPPDIPTPAAKPTAAVAAATVHAPVTGRTQWRVVAYTFNRESQAQQRAESLAKRNPSLAPEVFTPNGHAPYLVTVGGPMTREQAEAFKRKAISAGLPHDVYAQNYSR
ncbi:SPOR domain-containing protein [Edaphobacter aggregans]|uniref:SPOR domain-containing protein n=1 Tax=Edaphobacter aggregans TaxID=570835 RepID=UPI0014707869|nr:SPOR domain-containing protein [Edaphobacter aggregans]